MRAARTSRRVRPSGAWLGVALAAPLLALAPGAASAQSVVALQDTTCAGFRDGSALNCTAGEFTVGATFTASPGTPAFCTAGQVFTFDASLQLSGSNTDRYDIGFFVGQQGNSPTAAPTSPSDPRRGRRSASRPSRSCATSSSWWPRRGIRSRGRATSR